MTTHQQAGVRHLTDGWAWSVQFTDPSSGEDRSASGTGHATADEAAAARHEALLELANIRPRLHADMGLCALLRRWAQERSQTVSGRTSSTLHSRVHQICKTRYQKVPISDIDKADVVQIVRELRQQAPGPSTLVAKVRCLCSALDMAAERGLLEDNPTKGASAPELVRLAEAEARRIKEAARRQRLLDSGVEVGPRAL